MMGVKYQGMIFLKKIYFSSVYLQKPEMSPIGSKSKGVRGGQCGLGDKNRGEEGEEV